MGDDLMIGYLFGGSIKGLKKIRLILEFNEFLEQDYDDFMIP